MTLAELFTNNYEYLNTVAKRITRCKDHRMAPDLLNSTYLVVHEKHEKGMYIPETDEDFVKWFSKCMKNYFVWPNSEFNETYSPKEELKIDASFAHYDSFRNKDDTERQSVPILLVDQDALRNIEVSVEQANDFTKELIEISSSLGKIKTLQYIELIEFKRTLPPHEAILFELYFEKELSTRKIAELYSDDLNIMNYQSVNQMVNTIKSKIENYKWKQLNS